MSTAQREQATAELDLSEEKKAEEEQSLNADVTHEVIRREGEGELERSTSALAWSGLAAGLAMGFSLVAQGVLKAHLPDAGWTPLVVSLGYSLGFLMVVLGSQQLFTENTLTAVVPLLARPSGRMLGNVARLWSVVLLANLLGALLFALVVGRSALFSPPVHRAFQELGLKAVEPAFGTVVLKGVFAGWLIALMVWMLPAAESAQMWVIVLLTWLVGAGEFAHVIAGSAEVFYLAATGVLGWGESLLRFVAPALIGNVLGGVTLVAALNHAQVAAGGK